MSFIFFCQISSLSLKMFMPLNQL